MNTLLLFIGMASVYTSCWGQQKKDLKIYDAFSQEFISGVPGGSNTTTYQFKVVNLSKSALYVDSVWIQQKGPPLILANQRRESHTSIEVLPGDTVALQAIASTPGLESRNQVTSPSELHSPIPYQGAALLPYQIQGKKKYFILEQIQTLPQVIGQ